jgi:hypothetical protein
MVASQMQPAGSVPLSSPEREVERPEYNDGRLVIRLDYDRPLGLGYIGRFLSETDIVLEELRGEQDDPAEIERIETGSIIITVTVSGALIAGVATAGWTVFSYFHKQWIEKKRRDEQWAREDAERIRLERREDDLQRMREEREDRIRRESRQAPTHGEAQALDPRITNIVIIAGGQRYDFNELGNRRPPPPA